MKIKCGKESLLRGLQTVYRGVSTKNTIFALSGILIQAEDGVLTYKATDMEISMEYKDYNIDIEQEGSIILPGKYIMEIAKRLPDEEITLYTQGYTVYICYSGSEITINGYDQEEFPAFPKVEGEIYGSFELEDFQKDIKEVSIACALDESRPAFTGILFEIKGSKITMVATDTHRLALKEITWDNQGQKETGTALIPGKVLKELVRITPEEESTIQVVVSENQISFTIGNMVLISCLIQSKFPNYHSVIPAEEKFVAKAEVNVNHLLSTLERASVMVKDQTRDRAGKAKINLKNENFMVHSQNEEIGHINESIPVFQEGVDIELIVNSRYFIDFLHVVPTETAVFRFTGPNTPIVMQGKDEENYLYLALPLKA